jgi:hypothetical protein
MAAPFYEFHNMFDTKQIKIINKFIKNNYDRVAPTSEGATDLQNNELKFVDVKQIYWYKVKQYLESAYQFALNTIQHECGYLLHPFNDFRHINYNTYNSKHKHQYGYHLDDMKESSANSTKGTLLINVSDSKYTGGELLYWHNENEIHIDHLDKPGSMVYLRPHMYHKIKPVRSGIRKSISIFLTGPKWR